MKLALSLCVAPFVSVYSNVTVCVPVVDPCRWRMRLVLRPLDVFTKP